MAEQRPRPQTAENLTRAPKRQAAVDARVAMVAGCPPSTWLTIADAAPALEQTSERNVGQQRTRSDKPASTAARTGAGKAVQQLDAKLRKVGKRWLLDRAPVTTRTVVLKQQMALEVPDTTLTGEQISDREDLVAQYIISEKEKFGREIDHGPGDGRGRG